MENGEFVIHVECRQVRLVYSGISKQPQLLDLMNRLPGNDEYKQIKCKQEL